MNCLHEVKSSHYWHDGSRYISMNIVSLRFLKELLVLLSMYHPTIHGNSLSHDILDKVVLSSVPHSIDATLGKGKIDGFGEVERYCGGIAKIYVPR